MTDRVLRNRVNKLQALQNEVDKLLETVEALKSEIKAEMTARGVTELEAGDAVIRWKPITSTRFDTRAFKQAHVSLYNEFSAPTTSWRFSIVA